MQAYLEGFEEVLSRRVQRIIRALFPDPAYQLACIHREALRPFTVNEFDTLLCGEAVRFTHADLMAHTVCDHGFAKSSQAVLMLFDFLVTLNPAEVRVFWSLVTGWPKIQSGGLRRLKPPLTIVRKDPVSETGCLPSPDNCLPSVMTCQHYFKLPDYSSAALLRDRVLTAIHEGASSFHLS